MAACRYDILSLKEHAVKICFTGGGTAGHIMPALAVMEELRRREPDCDFLWIGRYSGQEKKMIEDSGCRWYGVASGKWRRYVSVHNFFDIFRIFTGFFQALRIIRKEKPAVVFSKGGFVSVPPLWAAHVLGIPTITHESDASPGLATRLNARAASYICFPYEEATAGLKKKYPHKIQITGNPVRGIFSTADAAKGRRLLSLDAGEPLIVITGGSQGARQVNEMVDGCLTALTETAYVFHQRGKGNLRTDFFNDRYTQVEFAGPELADFLAAADIVISRAGAGALSELTSLGKAMVLVPLEENASRGDQVLNAGRMEKTGAAVILSKDSADSAHLLETVRLLFSNDKARIRQMEAASASLNAPDACTNLADLILGAVNNADTAKAAQRGTEA